MGHKRALIVGINYVGTGNDLQGCINDANNMNAFITTKYGFQDVRMLLEKDATTANIKDGLRWLVSGCRPGDVLLFHYSGHGSQIRDTSDTDYEPDGLDEIICPIDLDWNTKVITDDYMKWVFDTVPAGVNLTVFLDCCHSGGALDQANQYQPTGPGVAREATLEGGRYLAPPPEMMALVEVSELPVKERSVQSRDVNNTGLLITGCQSTQTSADAVIDGVPQGAATYSLLHSLHKFNYDLEYGNLVEHMNEYMFQSGYTQRPELNGSVTLFLIKFLAPIAVAPEVVENYEPVDLPPAPATTQNIATVLETVNPSSDKKNLILIAVGVAVAALIAFLAFS